MLDISLFRDHTDRVREGLAARKADPCAVDIVLGFDAERRSLIQESDARKQRRNEISKSIPELARAKQPIDALKEESRRLGAEIDQIDARLAAIEEQQRNLLLHLPNLPHPSVPRGHSEHDNVVLRTWGEKPTFGFAPKPHWEVGTALGILDLERAAKISGSGFYVLKGMGAKLQRALITWMIDTHTTKNGYTEILPPHLVTRKTLTGTSQLPKFEEDMFRMSADELFLIPTAEVPVTNLYADEILDAAHLPLKHCAYTPCYRREAGGYGKESRGISRLHQFDKVEMVWWTKPEDSDAAHDELTKHATDLLEALGLHYRVVLLCSGDMGFGAAKCHDLELWAPGMDTWLEVSSCSTFGDFQARRANIRFRREAGAKPEFVHTLNGSGLALPRLVIALLECNQRADGSVAVPAVLQPYLGVSELRA
jgi:seryl-tRNA synthetase